MKPYVEALKALADDTRLRIIRLLLTNHTAMCVCELVDALEEHQYNVSGHLQILEAAGLIEGTKDGRWVYYSVAEPLQDAFVRALYQAVVQLPAIDDTVAADQARFQERMQLRDGDRCRVGIQKRYLIGGSPTAGTSWAIRTCGDGTGGLRPRSDATHNSHEGMRR